ncbi:uncharacterized protein [Ptychodera flava]|uniref:uncharacterized protein n=1 Tax=Ptychodera flava TaxID=63121 RepID=UPI00396A2D59
MVEFDEVLEYLGEFGPYQKQLYFLVCLIPILSMQGLAHVFLAAETDRWCNAPELEDYYENCTHQAAYDVCIETIKNFSVPLEDATGVCGDSLVLSNCYRYDISDIDYSPGKGIAKYINTTIKCDHGWMYDRSQYKSTVIQEEEEAEEGKASVVDLFRYPNMRKKTLNVFYNWFTASLVYYGLSLNTSNLGGSDYLNAFLSGAVEIPAYTLSLYIPQTILGRRWSMFVTEVIGGVACILTLFVPKSGVLALLLPETRNKKLPDSIEESEQFGKKTKGIKEEQSSKSNSVGSAKEKYGVEKTAKELKKSGGMENKALDTLTETSANVGSQTTEL